LVEQRLEVEPARHEDTGHEQDDRRGGEFEEQGAIGRGAGSAMGQDVRAGLAPVKGGGGKRLS